jgi:hypothetical protein
MVSSLLAKPVTRGLGSSHTSLRGALGDINGDGIDDFAVASSNTDYADRTAAGVVYIIYGRPDSVVVTDIDLAHELGEAGVKIGGAADGNKIGTAISGAGDVNGDGIRACSSAAPVAVLRAGKKLALRTWCTARRTWPTWTWLNSLQGRTV